MRRPKIELHDNLQCVIIRPVSALVSILAHSVPKISCAWQVKLKLYLEVKKGLRKRLLFSGKPAFLQTLQVRQTLTRKGVC